MKERIYVGDKVNVFFVTSDAVFDASVLHIPVATGDSWILREECGALTYVQEFEKMELVEATP